MCLCYLDIGEGVLIEKVDKFCYLGDMLNADGGCDSAVTARVRCAWKKFREYFYLYRKGILVEIEIIINQMIERRRIASQQ